MKFMGLGLIVAVVCLFSGPFEISAYAQKNGECFENCGGSTGQRTVLRSEVPDFDRMTLDEKLAWYREFGRSQGFSDSEIDAYINNAMPNREPAFTEHGDPYSLGGEEGYEIGCLGNAIFFPENGGCLEKDWNRARWDQTRALNGDGVLEATPPVDLDSLMPTENFSDSEIQEPTPPVDLDSLMPSEDFSDSEVPAESEESFQEFN